jgi:hypothetical protein
MVQRWATSSGFADVAGTWNGGTLPDPGDDLYANNFTVSIRDNLTANSLKKIAGTTAVAGGSFVVTAAATVNITAGIVATDNATNSSYLLMVDAGAAAVVVNADVAGGAGGNRWGVRVDTDYTGHLTINGDIAGGTSLGSHGVYSSAASCQITVNGTVVGGTTASTYGVIADGATTILTVNGSVTGGTGNATGYGVSNAGASSQVTISGSLTAATAPALNTTGGFLRLDVLLTWGSTGVNPFTATVQPQFKRTGSFLGMQAPSDDNWPAATGVAIVVERYTTGNPLPADVRDGTTYGPGATSTGTLAVPPPASVAAGVPTDDTVGTAALGLADVLAGTGAQIAAATSG